MWQRPQPAVCPLRPIYSRYHETDVMLSVSNKASPHATAYDQNGPRKCLTSSEREVFLKAADAAGREIRTFCGTLAYTGCRISEALALTADWVDLEAGANRL
jgi:integrase